MDGWSYIIIYGKLKVGKDLTDRIRKIRCLFVCYGVLVSGDCCRAASVLVMARASLTYPTSVSSSSSIGSGSATFLVQ